MTKIFIKRNNDIFSYIDLYSRRHASPCYHVLRKPLTPKFHYILMIGVFLTVSTCYKRSLVYSAAHHRENLSHPLGGAGGGVGVCAFRYYSISIQYCFDKKFSRRPYNFHFLMIFFWVKKSSSLNLSRYKFISTENSRS